MAPISESEIRKLTDPVERDWQDRHRALEHEFAAYRKERGSLLALFEELREAVRPIDPLPAEYTKPRQRSRVKSACAVVMRTSDGHHGAVQEPSEIEGMGAFSPEIGRARQLGFARAVVEWVELHRNAYTIPTLHHIVTGDLISGDIHEELRVTNAWPAPVQAIRAGELLAEQVAVVAPHFERIIVEFVVEDNHARLTRRPQAKEAGLNSYNYIVGAHAKALLATHKNVTFNLYPMYETVVSVLSRRYLICHGHGIMGWAGVPWYGIERKVGREAQARLRVIMEEQSRASTLGFHRYLFGHLHTPICTPLYMGCGSVSGTDAYDHKQGRYAVPSQSSFLVHPRHGEFDCTDWDLRIYDA
jgi:hypothetical protein